MNVFLRAIDLDMGKQEYAMYQEIPREEMGAQNNAYGVTYRQFKHVLKEKIAEASAPLNEKSTPRKIYIMYVSDYPVGEIAIRPELNQFWYNHSGHIGYKIRPSERRKGYGKIMLKLALEKCKDMGINEPLLQCSKQNIASQKTIEGNGGVLIDEYGDTKYYKIKI